MKVGDIVARQSHKQDLFFRIEQIMLVKGERVAILKGINLRLIADAPLHDLVEKNPTEVAHYQRKDDQDIYNKLRFVVNQRKYVQEAQDEFYEIPGRILHLDGDEDYLSQCIKTYQQLGLEAKGICISEAEQPKKLGIYSKKIPRILWCSQGTTGF